MILAVLFFLLFPAITFVPAHVLGEETIRVAVPLFPALGFPLFVATEKGYFQKEGLRTEIVRINSTPTTYQALLSGGVDVAIGAPAGLVTVTLQGTEVAAIGSWDNVMPYILATREKITDIEQLRGKKLAVNRPGSTPWLIMRVLLEDAGLSKDVRLIPLAGGSQERLAALTSSGIDAAPVSWALEPNLKKSGLYAFKGNKTPFLTGAICVKKSYLQSHRSTLKKFMKGLLDGAQFVLNDKTGTFLILAKILRTENKETLEFVYDYMRLNESPTHYPPPDSIKNLLRMAAYEDQRAASVRPEMIVDFAILEELGQKSPRPSQK